jgi:hypothetical protein
LRAFYDLPEALVYNYMAFLRHSSEVVTLNPLVTAPIRDVNDVIVMQTAIAPPSFLIRCHTCRCAHLQSCAAEVRDRAVREVHCFSVTAFPCDRQPPL